MIVARDATGNLILLGLSRKNIEGLTADKPIFISPGSRPGILPPELGIAILFGETEQSIAKHLGETVEVHDVSPSTKPTDHVAGLLSAGMIGPTGKLEGEKIRPDDDGELRAAMAINGKFIEIHFGTPCRWLALGRSEASAMIDKLIEMRDKLPE